MKRFALFAFFVAVALCVLVGLGTWQLERKAWKDALIAELQAKLAAPPTDLPARERWQRLTAATDEFRRVAFPAEFLSGEEALVYSSGSSLRPDVSGPGYFVFAPARLPGGQTVVINRGYSAQPDAKPVRGNVDVVGYLRFPESGSLFVADHDANTWFVRDQRAMAKELGWGDVAPFYVDQEGPQPAGGLPKAGPLKAGLPNNHLQYAVTWYGLALVILIAAMVFWRARRRGVS